MRPVEHNKTGNIYFIIQDEIIDATNSSNNQAMVLYMNMRGELFVREKNEFWIKFSSISEQSLEWINLQKK